MLSPRARAGGAIALTLRTLGGLTTPEIARAFLVPEPTLAQRLVRAKKKIRDAGHRVRGARPATGCADRLDSVLRVLYLVFNEGYDASSGDALIRRELCAEAIRLARVVATLMPGEPEARGCSRSCCSRMRGGRPASGPAGELVRLEDQDRARWSRAEIAEGARSWSARCAWAASGRTSSRPRSRPSTTRRRRRPTTDWPQILGLYEVLVRVTPSPVVDAQPGGRASPRSRGPGRAGGGRRHGRVTRRSPSTGYFHASARGLPAPAGALGRGRRRVRAGARAGRNGPERAFLERRIAEVRSRAGLAGPARGVVERDTHLERYSGGSHGSAM